MCLSASIFAQAPAKRPPAAPPPSLQEALQAHQAGQLDLAVEKYRAYLKVNPSSVEAHSNLGAVLARQGRLEEAIPEYRAALKLA
ncbi:MAG TPA: hypothetical protein DEH78_12700, partial [Solibacterales bacterium]|nr:hypothetical protein [Bryobacterales bacterium]